MTRTKGPLRADVVLESCRRAPGTDRSRCSWWIRGRGFNRSVSFVLPPNEALLGFSISRVWKRSPAAILREVDIEPRVVRVTVTFGSFARGGGHGFKKTSVSCYYAVIPPCRNLRPLDIDDLVWLGIIGRGQLVSLVLFGENSVSHSEVVRPGVPTFVSVYLVFCAILEICVLPLLRWVVIGAAWEKISHGPAEKHIKRWGSSC